jgi:ATP-dependent DNA ligase
MVARWEELSGARQAYLDGELGGVRPDGVTSFSMIQAASDSGNAAGLVFFLFDLLYLDGEDLCARAARATRLRQFPPFVSSRPGPQEFDPKAAAPVLDE